MENILSVDLSSATSPIIEEVRGKDYIEYDLQISIEIEDFHQKLESGDNFGELLAPLLLLVLTFWSYLLRQGHLEPPRCHLILSFLEYPPLPPTCPSP